MGQVAGLLGLGASALCGSCGGAVAALCPLRIIGSVGCACEEEALGQCQCAQLSGEAIMEGADTL